MPAYAAGPAVSRPGDLWVLGHHRLLCADARDATAYKALLGALRVFLVLITMCVLLPQLQLRFDRQGWPDVVVLVDDSRSMGEPDSFQDEKIRDRTKVLGEAIKKKLLETGFSP